VLAVVKPAVAGLGEILRPRAPPYAEVEDVGQGSSLMRKRAQHLGAPDDTCALHAEWDPRNLVHADFAPYKVL
jgi:hypothetical protein